MTKLQNILFPKPSICFIPEMFYRLVNIPGRENSLYHFDTQGQRLIIDKDGIAFFDTYFNGLSVGKWGKYTTVTEFTLSLEIKGTFSVSLLHSKYVNGAVVQKILATEIFFSSQRQLVNFSFPKCESVGAISFSLNSLEDGSILFGGGYYATASEAEPQTVNLALNICNYKREEYIYRNMYIVNKYIFGGSDSRLKDHLFVFVADNSKSVDPSRLPQDSSFIYPQGDFGGAGGFTRGLMEILNKKEELELTHVVMIDDDILLEPDSLERLYSFLRFIKPSYQSAFVGGSLLRMDFQNIQTCDGGEWDAEKTYRFHKINFELRSLADVLKNELEDGASINAWWFHCIPLSKISLRNLPYPFFFHMDDVEYDLRNCKQIIHLNGICVWHEPFEYKPGSHLSYYNTRNIFITHILHFSGWNCRSAKRFLWNEFFPSLFLYRYREAALVLLGAEDAMKGPDWLIAQNPEGLLEDILSKGYKKQPLDILPIRLDYSKYLSTFQGGPPESKRKRLLRRLSLNGYLLKAKKETIIPMYKPAIRTVYRAKRVLNYDPITERGFITQKSYKEAFRLLWRYLKVQRLISKRFKKAREEYLAKFPEMTTSSFWYSYLGVSQKDEVGSGAPS